MSREAWGVVVVSNPSRRGNLRHSCGDAEYLNYCTGSGVKNHTSGAIQATASDPSPTVPQRELLVLVFWRDFFFFCLWKYSSPTCQWFCLPSLSLASYHSNSKEKGMQDTHPRRKRQNNDSMSKVRCPRLSFPSFLILGQRQWPQTRSTSPIVSSKTIL